jgi:hypothetical protein
MALTLKVAVSGMVLAIAVGALDRFLHWMNQASDLSLYAGLFGVMCLVVVVPAALALIWRKIRG